MSIYGHPRHVKIMFYPELGLTEIDIFIRRQTPPHTLPAYVAIAFCEHAR